MAQGRRQQTPGIQSPLDVRAGEVHPGEKKVGAVLGGIVGDPVEVLRPYAAPVQAETNRRHWKLVGPPDPVDPGLLDGSDDRAVLHENSSTVIGEVLRRIQPRCIDRIQAACQPQC